ncbi:hypothetical protein BZG36_05391 [Bifiguratus adelaidae]|uniref:Uncharacterized protein n=1 Tax=Bifiguratus adelaidae TaxID=1938954 RepID=A0A261XTI2_9FUNG|nr:hypothetical protein BZG36_05391 [Bifiguratus adelaidae]
MPSEWTIVLQPRRNRSFQATLDSIVQETNLGEFRASSGEASPSEAVGLAEDGGLPQPCRGIGLANLICSLPLANSDTISVLRPHRKTSPFCSTSFQNEPLCTYSLPDSALSGTIISRTVRQFFDNRPSEWAFRHLSTELILKKNQTSTAKVLALDSSKAFQALASLPNLPVNFNSFNDQTLEEEAVFKEEASKIQIILDRLHHDLIKSEAGYSSVKTTPSPKIRALHQEATLLLARPNGLSTNDDNYKIMALSNVLHLHPDQQSPAMVQTFGNQCLKETHAAEWRRHMDAHLRMPPFALTSYLIDEFDTLTLDVENFRTSSYL